MSEMSRVAVTPDTDPSGVPTGSSPTAPAARSGGQVAPGGTGPTATLDAQSEAEVPRTARTGSPDRGGSTTSASDPHPSHWRPAFVDNDARPVPTTRETVQVKGGVL